MSNASSTNTLDASSTKHMNASSTKHTRVFASHPLLIYAQAAAEEDVAVAATIRCFFGVRNDLELDVCSMASPRDNIDAVDVAVRE